MRGFVAFFSPLSRKPQFPGPSPLRCSPSIRFYFPFSHPPPPATAPGRRPRTRIIGPGPGHPPGGGTRPSPSPRPGAPPPDFMFTLPVKIRWSGFDDTLLPPFMKQHPRLQGGPPARPPGRGGGPPPVGDERRDISSKRNEGFHALDRMYYNAQFIPQCTLIVSK